MADSARRESAAPVASAAGAVAIVGMAFRFPGDLCDEQGFWSALRAGRDLVTQVPADRWAVDALQHPKRAEPGRSITFSAGVLSNIGDFDAAFFGISPREAAALDPQQRLLLELSWEAMENAGVKPASLAGSDCAVFVGIAGLDYGIRSLDDLASMGAHSMTGNTLSVAANRLSYYYDLRGPSMAVDTACSSSLVALNQACRCLAGGEASAALVGGVNLLLHPYPFVGFTKASMLSANGRCRAFDAAGDGYVRAEGGAVLLLKPLARAEADGDPIHAVIIGSGVNADGARKTGITIPSQAGQAELMRGVMARAGLASDAVDYVEAHGTGTAVGDPIEAAAIGEVYGRGRASPLPIGSVKTNLGHLEPASGMAGLVKAVQVLKHAEVPPTLHLETPNPNIDFAGLNLDVVTRPTALACKRTRPAVVGVNSFGFGGVNAHVLMRGYPARAEIASAAPQAVPPLLLSARSDAALRAMAAGYAQVLGAGADYYDVAHAAAHRRQLLEKRVALPGGDVEATIALLTRYAEGEEPLEILREDAPAEPGAVAFIYSGNGSQWPGMGRRLLAESKRFAAIIAELDAAIAARAGFSVHAELEADAADARLDDTAIAQPVLFAVQVAVTRMLRERGVEAAAVAGHSVGEVAAAWAAGALDLDQAIEVVCLRSGTQATTRGQGRMAAVGLSAEAMQAVLDEANCPSVEIAGINSPNNVTIAGSAGELAELRLRLTERKVFFRPLDLDYAFHSRAMEPIRAPLEAGLAGLSPAATAIPFVSTVTGGPMPGEALGAAYWWDNVRRPVRFMAAIKALAERGCRVFIEIGPHAILQRYVGECLGAAQRPGRVLPTLRRHDDGPARIDEAALRAQLCAQAPDIAHYFPVAGRFVALPNYPWQRERHWHATTAESAGLLERRRVHPLLGWRLKDHPAAWENALDPLVLPYLADHRVGDAIVLPAAAYVEMALAASREWFGNDACELETLDIVAPVVFDGDHARSLRFELQPREGVFRILSRQRLSDEPWKLNAAGRLLGAPTRAAAAVEFPATGASVDRDTHYRLAGLLGLDYGPAFQAYVDGRVEDRQLTGRLALPKAAGEGIHLLHPALLDACFQSLVGFLRGPIEAGQGLPMLPIGVGRLRYWGGAPVAFRARLVRFGSRSAQVDFVLADEAGKTVAMLEGCRFRAATLKAGGKRAPAQWQMVATPMPHPADALPAIVPANADLAAGAAEALVGREPLLHRRDHFQDAMPLLEALVAAFAYAAFQEVQASGGERLTALLEDAAAGAGSRPLVLRLARMLEDNGWLALREGAWRLAEAEVPPAEDIWRTLAGDFPEMLPELLLAGRVGRRLPALLGGQEEARGLIDSIRHSHQLAPLFESSPTYLGINLALRDVMANLGRQWPAHRRLRVLEISGAAADLPRQLTPLLPAGRTDYVVACDAAERLDLLEAEYAGHERIATAALDAESLELTGAAGLPERYDVVIAHHWLHQPRNLPAAVAALRRKLAPGGLLLVAERHPDAAADLVFGLDASWWHATESGFASSLLAAGEWADLLARAGLESIETLTEPAAGEFDGGCYLMLARNAQAHAIETEAVEGRWLLLADAAAPADALAMRLGEQLRSRGQRVRIAGGYPADADATRRLLGEAAAELGGLDHVVGLAGVGADSAGGREHCIDVLHLVQALGDGDAVRLWLVTAGGALVSEPAGDWRVDPMQAALWGMGRVIMNERPNLRCTLIDLAGDTAAPATVDRLRRELLAPDGETEIVLAPQARFGLRMQRRQPAAPGAEPSRRFHLDFRTPGRLADLAWLPDAERALAPDEIEVRPAAVGLNFRDVMYAMGLLPDEAVDKGFSGASLGLEFAGTVSRVGSRVSDYRAGDAVMGFGPACFASHVVTRAGALARKPEDWSFAQAATVPTVFFTVYYAFKQLANLQAGERVLIHGAAGGVGIAAIQLARHLGAEIFATAGSDEKRDFVRLLGADHVFDSRSYAFADDILEATQGEGVDVVLNSLAGEAINRNLRVLKPFGRFLELGKRDFYENTHIGLRPFKDNISYFGIDADQLLVAQPRLAARLFSEVMKLFEAGLLAPLPYRSFAASRVVEAFRTMQQSRQIGKIVVELGDDAEVAVAEPAAAEPALRLEREATYLVTGGLAGFGLASARWLAERGAGHLVLVGRRGIDTPGAAEAVAELTAAGSQVHAFACDVADRAALEALLRRIALELPPLRGVLHAAAVIDDALMVNLDDQRFRRAFDAKALGAWHLHQLTLDLPLDHFILYSSVTAALGNPGQANYVAANASLEALASLRRANGLPATCIGWGPIGDAGYLARNADVKDSLAARLGAEPLAAAQALAALARALAADAPPVTVADFDWHALAGLMPAAAGPRFELLRRTAGKREGGVDSVVDLRALLAGKTAGEAREIVQEMVVAEVAQILRIAPERIDPARSLYDLGMDSLMAVELALGIEKRFGISLPAMALGEGPSAERVAARIAGQLLGEAAAEGGVEDIVRAMAAQHAENLSAADIEGTIAAVRREATSGARLTP